MRRDRSTGGRGGACVGAVGVLTSGALACLRRRAWHVCGGCFPAVMMSGGVAGLACCGIVSPAGVVGLLTSGGLLAVLMSRPGADDRG